MTSIYYEIAFDQIISGLAQEGFWLPHEFYSDDYSWQFVRAFAKEDAFWHQNLQGAEYKNIPNLGIKHAVRAF